MKYWIDKPEMDGSNATAGNFSVDVNFSIRFEKAFDFNIADFMYKQEMLVSIVSRDSTHGFFMFLGMGGGGGGMGGGDLSTQKQRQIFIYIHTHTR